jgi:DNA (cytosine-5)-methyltransferase 1
VRYISLFSGAGISDVGFDRAGWECLAQVEIDKQANDVRRRHFPDVQHFEDIRSFDAKQFHGRVDAVVGGFPCQDYSVAGQRGGLVGDRGALWWEFHRVIREARPRIVVGENVPGLLSSGGGRDFGAIVESLVELGYRVAWRVLDLRYFGIPQRRRRVFIVASLGSGRCAEILFEPESLSRHPAESREKRESDTQDVAGSLGGGSGARGFNNSLDVCGAFIPEVANALRSRATNQADAPDYATYIPEVAPYIAEPVAFNMQSYAQDAGELSGTLGVGHGIGVAEPVAFCNTAGDTALGTSGDGGRTAPPITSRHGDPGCVALGWRVRRLTPVECERLMGLPDGYTELGVSPSEVLDKILRVPRDRFILDINRKRRQLHGKDIRVKRETRKRLLLAIKRRKSAERGLLTYPVADGPRYKMLGNGWSVPQAEWIARRCILTP